MAGGHRPPLQVMGLQPVGDPLGDGFALPRASLYDGAEILLECVEQDVFNGCAFPSGEHVQNALLVIRERECVREPLHGAAAAMRTLWQVGVFLGGSHAAPFGAVAFGADQEQGAGGWFLLAHNKMSLGVLEW